MSSPRVERRLRRTRQPEGYSPARLVAVVVILGAWMVILGARLHHLQVSRYDFYQEAARRQQERRIEEHPPRGLILDARGRELAVSVEVPTVFADPELMREREVDRDDAARRLAESLSLDTARVRRLLDDPSSFVYVKRRVGHDEARRVEELGIAGVGLLSENRRVYPMGRVAAHVLGFVGHDNRGLAGLESRYQAEIAGKPALRRVRLDAARNMMVVPTALGPQAQPGADLLLTIDARIQHIVERELERAVRQTGSRAGSAVFLDPRDSAILAMASLPSFDPNSFRDFEARTWRNRAVMDAYEPGSTFKMITAAAALESLAVHPDDRFDCEMGGVSLDRAYIRDHKPFGVLTFREVLANSSNVGMIKAALRTGSEPFVDQVTGFGFGVPTGVDLPGESAGIVRPRERWNTMSTAYASFGHGISVTPLQLANAYAALLSGEVHRPYVVRALRRDGKVQPVARPAGQPLRLSEKTRRELIRLLEHVVEEGTGRRAAVEGYRVAGKTGTAEKSSSEGMSETGRVASFVGFAPSRGPRLVGLVMLDEPAATPSGGLLAAPVFAEVARESLIYLGIAPVLEEWQQADNVLRPESPPRRMVLARAGGSP
ncbi:MAG: penicillin-binding protein 2 [Acidobacteria bacterium]|nr:MAG: penicillin-binding protein 2 [Acidobacteriota bacterium]REK00470.1 MAG: penicillin-binding protein 2 [Acidobacteriota bacterium]